MTIQPGTRLGPYEITAPLGAGGMGEVWKGRDTRLDRDVAINGRWMVYESDSTGRFEVYVRSVDGGSDQWRISTDCGMAGRWASGGTEILYVSLDGRIMTGPTQLSPRFRPGTPTELFRLPEPPEMYSPLFEDVTPDGKRVLLNLPTESRSALAFHLITNWTALVSG